MIIAYRASSSATFAAGMPVFLDGSSVYPASEFFWNTDLDTTQQDFSQAFMGIATGPKYQEGGLWRVDVELSPNVPIAYESDGFTISPGALLAPAEGSFQTLSDTQWTQVATPGRAVARAVSLDSPFATSGKLTIASAFHTGSSNVNAQVGT